MSEIAFSKLASRFNVAPNALYSTKARLMSEGTAIIDLVSGNLADQGIQFPPDLLDRAMLDGLRQSRGYAPNPLGQPAAREAVAHFYRSADIDVSCDHIVITPGTSIAYWYAFRALCDEGDEILCPRPGYPLFDGIAEMCGVQMRGYPLRLTASRWELDLESAERAITHRTRAIILVSPHNPTGHVAASGEVERLIALSVKHGLPIIADEVFSPFVFTEKSFARPAASADALVITLNGFSKMLALPGLKFGWMAVTGPGPTVDRFCRIVEHLSDTFLPVNEAAQRAAPLLLEGSQAFQQAFRDFVADRRQRAAGVLAASLKRDFLVPEGGFYWAFALAEGADEETVCLKILNEQSALTHPGYFYDFAAPYLVCSFLDRKAMEYLTPSLKTTV